MIGLAWWLWGKTPANLLARTAFGLVLLAAFKYRRQIKPYVEEPYKSLTGYLDRLSAKKKKN